MKTSTLIISIVLYFIVIIMAFAYSCSTGQMICLKNSYYDYSKARCIPYDYSKAKCIPDKSIDLNNL